MMRVYLDNCCFNRPYDSQSNFLVKLEAEAKLMIQEMIRKENLDLVWSYILEAENDANPHEERKKTIEKWKYLAKKHIGENNAIIARAEKFVRFKLKEKDALHLSCAIEAKSSYFITTDKDFLKRSTLINEIKIFSPIHFLEDLEKSL